MSVPRRSGTAGKVNLAVLLGGFAFILPLLAVLASGFGRDPKAVPSMLEQREAPPFELVDLDGRTVKLAALRGTPVMLNFWSTWCGPCKYEHPMLLQAAKQWPDVKFYGVIYNDEPAKVKHYLRSAGTGYPHLVDPQNRVAIDYGVTGVPESFFIDRGGRILHKQTGPLNPPALESQLARLVQP